MDKLRPLPRTSRGNRYVLLITNRYSKIPRAFILYNTTAPHAGNVFLEDWIIPYDIISYLLTDNGPQFVAKCFSSVCASLGRQQLTTTGYLPQTTGFGNRQTERYNNIIVAHLRHYVVKQRGDWDDFVQRLTYAYNMHVHRSTICTLFSQVLKRQPLHNMEIIGPTALTTDQSGTTSGPVLGTHILRSLKKVTHHTDKSLHSPQRRCKHYFDRRIWTTAAIEPGQHMYVERGTKATQSPVKRLAEASHTNILSRIAGHFELLSFTTDTVTVREGGIPKTVSIDRVSIDPEVSESKNSSIVQLGLGEKMPENTAR